MLIEVMAIYIQYLFYILINCKIHPFWPLIPIEQLKDITHTYRSISIFFPNHFCLEWKLLNLNNDNEDGKLEGVSVFLKI